MEIYFPRIEIQNMQVKCYSENNTLFMAIVSSTWQLGFMNINHVLYNRINEFLDNVAYKNLNCKNYITRDITLKYKNEKITIISGGKYNAIQMLLSEQDSILFINALHSCLQIIEKL